MKFCKKCQTETRRNTKGVCYVCAASYVAAYRAANPDKIKADKAAYHAAHPEKAMARSAAYYAANKANLKILHSEWRRANPDRVKASNDSWAKANPEARRINEQNRKARKRKNGGALSQGLSAKLFKLQRGKCACCGLPLGVNFHLDHIVPIALGGPNTDDNIQLLSPRCNSQKRHKHPVDFMQERGFLL